MNVISMLIQSNTVGGFTSVAEQNLVTGLLVSIIFALSGVIMYLAKKNEKIGKAMTRQQIDCAEKRDELRKEYNQKIEQFTKEYLQHEELRNKQWAESEKETLQVLNGVTMILEMGEKAGKYETEKILEKIDNTETRILDNIKSLQR